MFKKLKKVAAAYGRSVRNNRVLTAAIVTGTAAGGAFAADGTFDMTTPLLYIAGAVTAYATIGPAMAGLTYLKTAWKKLGG